MKHHRLTREFQIAVISTTHNESEDMSGQEKLSLLKDTNYPIHAVKTRGADHLTIAFHPMVGHFLYVNKRREAIS